MNIIITCPNPPWITGGIERVVAEITTRLAYKHSVTIYTIGQSENTCKWNNVTVKTFRNWRGELSPSLINVLKRECVTCDVIHTHSLSTTLPLETFLSLKKRNMVLSPHYHPGGSTLLYHILKRLYDPCFGKAIVAKAKTIICVSETEKSNIQRIFRVKSNKIVVIPNGVNAALISGAKRFEVDSNSIIVLYVGRLERYKNIHRLIETVPHLPSEYRLVIIGDGTYKEELHKLVSVKSLQKRIHILSGLPDDVIYRWMKTCHLMVNLSDEEAFGITVLEGLAAGKPVLVNNRNALVELAKKFDQVTALNVASLTAKDIAQQIIAHATEKDHVPDLTDYSWDTITKQLQQVYEKI
jgi:glycosyltransferase involved in cell wall biosynthesis